MTGRVVTVVLDDDPTGSQAVHGIPVVLLPDVDEVERIVEDGRHSCFVLTNSRSLNEAEAVALTSRFASELMARLPSDVRIRFVSRSDSTLRGHIWAEIAALDAVHDAQSGSRADLVLLAPAFFEAGRFTEDDVQWATIAGEPVPVAQTEFARDAAFGYSTSNLAELMIDRSGGALTPDSVISLSTDDVRIGGVEAVRDRLLSAPSGTWVIVNATGYDDYDVVAEAVRDVEARGRTVLYRTGPSFVRSLLEITPIPVLDDRSIRRSLPEASGPRAHTLVIVGSHTALTNGQLQELMSRLPCGLFEMDVDLLLDHPEKFAEHAEQLVRDAAESLHERVTVLCTSRSVRAGTDTLDSLGVARLVSDSVSAITARLMLARPRAVIAKGGITSHDIAVNGLGIASAEVLGQLMPGQVSVFLPVRAAERARGVPYVVFPGNVGGNEGLAHAAAIVEGLG